MQGIQLCCHPLSEEVDVFGAIPEGDMDLTHVIGAVLASLASIIGGFSLGPEAATGILAGALGVWVSQKRGLPKEIRRTNLFSAVAGAFAGLFTAPFAVIAMGLEIKHRQTSYYYDTLAIIAVSALLGFTIFYTASRDRFSEVLRLLELPAYTLDQWHLPVAVLLGMLAVPFAFLFAALVQRLRLVMAPLRDKPILRCGLIGLLLGLLGMAMPSTLFLGSGGLETILNGRSELGVGFIIMAAFLKILATTTALAAGFIGGPIFPLFFVGGAIDVVIWQTFPVIPLSMAVGCLMAAVPAAVVPFPLTLGVIVLLITSIPV